jgi:hypothetical protein
MSLSKQELQRFVDEARNIVDSYIDNLPGDVSIGCAVDATLHPPHRTVIETDRSVWVQAWISIPKDHSSICFAPADAGEGQ